MNAEFKQSKSDKLVLGMEISVILPVYNKERYIESILNDIIAQTFPNYECIIIDDGSTDMSGNICDDFAAMDGRFYVLHISNGGVSHARNIGLKKASGRYITFVDADDHIEPDYLRRLYTDIASSHADIVIAGPLKVWKDNRQPVAPTIPYRGLQRMDALLPDFAEVQKATGIYGFCWGKIMPRELLADVRFSEWLRLAEDFEFYLRVYPKIKTVYFDNQCKYFYLQEAENSSAIVSSSDIDYFAQLRVNLSYRRFLQNVGYWSEDNQRIVDMLIANYAFFSVFYCARERIPTVIEDVHDLLAENELCIRGQGLLQSMILFCVQRNIKKLPHAIMKIYDVLRVMKRRL